MAAAAAAGVAALVLAAEDPGPERQRRQPTEHGCFYLLATRRGRAGCGDGGLSLSAKDLQRPTDHDRRACPPSPPPLSLFLPLNSPKSSPPYHL